MLENKKAVIFDLDGTLVDSMWMSESILLIVVQLEKINSHSFMNVI